MTRFAARAALTSALVSSAAAFAHGEDKPGPHGGFIRMPGAFHAELVPRGDSGFDVYLLDLANGNPTTQQAAVRAEIAAGDVTSSVDCAEKADHFTCALPPKLKLLRGQIVLKTTRHGAVGTPATYALPLEYKHAAPH